MDDIDEGIGSNDSSRSNSETVLSDLKCLNGQCVVDNPHTLLGSQVLNGKNGTSHIELETSSGKQDGDTHKECPLAETFTNGNLTDGRSDDTAAEKSENSIENPPAYGSPIVDKSEENDTDDRKNAEKLENIEENRTKGVECSGNEIIEDRQDLNKDSGSREHISNDRLDTDKAVSVTAENSMDTDLKNTNNIDKTPKSEHFEVEDIVEDSQSEADTSKERSKSPILLNEGMRNSLKGLLAKVKSTDKSKDEEGPMKTADSLLTGISRSSSNFSQTYRSQS